tara:strand:+ start:89 stop:742 length:654 start_codon:yes stop_codon:yes gene_type:complete
MKLAEKTKIIVDILNHQYSSPPIPLNHKDPYTLLIAVVLSAQCKDERVNQITPKLFRLANSPEQMMELSIDQIYSIIRPCGLGPQKSKSIHQLSKIIFSKFHGQVPSNLKDLESLPGVGHKTASVVISQGFGIPAFPVDTHIHRLAQRWSLTNGKNVIQTEHDLKRAFDQNSWNKLHIQMIYWGREFCQAHKCHGLECAICKAINPKRKRPFVHKRP